MIRAGGCVNRFLEPGPWASIANGSPQSREDGETRLVLSPRMVLRPVIPLHVPAEGPTV